MDTTPSSTVYCIQKANILLLRRRREPFAGYWVAPGGKILAAESPRECAIRELREETGLRALDLFLRGIIVTHSTRPELRWLMFIYAATAFEGELTAASQEGTLRWWNIDEYKTLKSPDADQVFTSHILALDKPVYEAIFVYDGHARLESFVEYTSS